MTNLGYMYYKNKVNDHYERFKDAIYKAIPWDMQYTREYAAKASAKAAVYWEEIKRLEKEIAALKNENKRLSRKAFKFSAEKYKVGYDADLHRDQIIDGHAFDPRPAKNNKKSA